VGRKMAVRGVRGSQSQALASLPIPGISRRGGVLRFLVWAISAALGPGALLAVWERHKGAIHGDESWAVMAFLYCGMSASGHLPARVPSTEAKPDIDLIAELALGFIPGDTGRGRSGGAPTTSA